MFQWACSSRSPPEAHGRPSGHMSREPCYLWARPGPGDRTFMTDLVERWPAGTVQLVLAGRFDPPLRQHRLRMSGQLCEIRDRDLYFSLTESHDLLANF